MGIYREEIDKAREAIVTLAAMMRECEADEAHMLHEKFCHWQRYGVAINDHFVQELTSAGIAALEARYPSLLRLRIKRTVDDRIEGRDFRDIVRDILEID